ncbi:hypothetical protein D9615_005324 [Tricholomella constricta]|uniref:Endonuclease/exonuclease/phosphatase domain-containing protein n=1 Tax=Tricholomella constricta TaxID=117010 RepID=A0A8H5H677_9AGAR|nr:hypothetical protein D9615_005324 [Tricholomella constricta]
MDAKRRGTGGGLKEDGKTRRVGWVTCAEQRRPTDLERDFLNANRKGMRTSLQLPELDRRSLLFFIVPQAGILVRETSRFRTELKVNHWPCIISGDFNFAPDDAAYSLLVGDTLLPEQEQRLLSSYVVHFSVDPTVPRAVTAALEEGGEEAVDPDRVITSARAATPADGLLSPTELIEFFSRIPRLRSTYDFGLSKVKDLAGLQTFGSRVALGPSRRGSYEPAYTSYTHYWKTVLDYVFVMDPVDRRSDVIALLSLHRTADLEPGLPQKGVCSSDHISLAAELCCERTRES